MFIGGRIVWVENARTQELVPILLTHAFADAENDEIDHTSIGNTDTDKHIIPMPSLLDTKGDQDTELDFHSLGESGELAGENPRSSEFRDLAASMQIFYLISQGLFAGFCFSTLYSVIGSQSDDTAFLSNYMSSASEHRRLTYLLGAVSLVGSFDTLLQILSTRSRDMQTMKLSAADSQQSIVSFRPQISSMGQFLSEILTGSIGLLAHTAAFISTLIMSITDVRIATRNDFQAFKHTLPAHETWQSFALDDSSFRFDFSMFVLCIVCGGLLLLVARVA